MTDHETPTEAEARRVLFEFYAPNDSERWDGFEKRMDAYAEAVRAAERARLAGLVRDLGDADHNAAPDDRLDGHEIFARVLAIAEGGQGG